jgi:hypothetical protein
MDIDGLSPGADFVKAIKKKVGETIADAWWPQ